MEAMGAALITVGQSPIGTMLGYLAAPLEAIGGGSLLTGLSTAASTISTYSSMEIQAQQVSMAAEREAIRAKDEELMRRRNLMQAMASQNLALGARGITMEGSEEASRKEQLDIFGYEQGVSSALSRSTQAGYRASAAAKRTGGTVRSGISLMEGVYG